MKKSLVFTWFIIVVAVLVRLVPILTENVFFHFDSARDWLWVRDIVILKQLTLVGPWASLQGIFYGPLTYYLLAVFFWVFDGNPIGGSIYALVTNVLTLIIFFKFVEKKFDSFTTIVSLVLLSFSAISLNISTFIFQSNPSLLLGVLFLPYLHRLNKGKARALPWLFLLVGLGVHTNFFWTIFLVPYLVLLVYILAIRLKVSLVIKSLVFFFVPLVFQILFELRHGFLQTKSLLAFVIGSNQSLGGNEALWPRIVDRGKLFFSLLQQSVGVKSFPADVLLLVIVAVLLWLSLNLYARPKKRFILLLLGLPVSFALGAVIFPAQFKLWYLYGLVPVFSLLVAIALKRLYSFNKITKLVVIGYLFVFTLSNIKMFLSFQGTNNAKNMKLLKNQKQVVSNILQLGKGQVYGVYTYTEPIYDYPYQFLFWWMSLKGNTGPVSYSYLPEKYDYVSNKKLYDPEPRKVDTVFLIMEKDNPASDYRWETWLPAFGEFATTGRYRLINQVEVERRVRQTQELL